MQPSLLGCENLLKHKKEKGLRAVYVYMQSWEVALAAEMRGAVESCKDWQFYANTSWWDQTGWDGSAVNFKKIELYSTTVMSGKKLESKIHVKLI